MKFKKSNTKKDRRDSLSRRREKILNEVGVIPRDQRSLESGWETFFPETDENSVNDYCGFLFSLDTSFVLFLDLAVSVSHFFLFPWKISERKTVRGGGSKQRAGPRGQAPVARCSVTGRRHARTLPIFPLGLYNDDPGV